MSEQPQVEAPPLSAVQVGRVISKDTVGRGGTEIRGIIEFLGKTPAEALDAVAGSHIPRNTSEACLTSIFGERGRPTDASLVTLYNSLNGKMVNLEGVLDPNRLVAFRPQVRAELSRIVLQTPGFADYYNSLPNQLAKDQFLDNIIDRGTMQAAGRQKFIEAVVVSSENTRYQSLNKEVQRLKARENQLEQRTQQLDGQLVGFDKARSTAEQQKLTRSNEGLGKQIERASQIIIQLQQANQGIENTYRKQPNVDLADKLTNDQTYQQNKAQITAYEGLITQTEQVLDQNLTQLETIEQKLAADTEKNTVETQLEELRGQITIKEGEFGEARQQLLKTISELSTRLDKILPEAAVEALKKFELRANDANKARLIEEAKVKQKQGKETGDKVTQAQGELLEAITRRYRERYTHRNFWGKTSERYRTNQARLLQEFRILMTQGSGALIDHILTNNPGIDPVLVTFLNNPANAEAKKQFMDNVKADVYKTIARDGVQSLKLDDQTIKTLALSDEFVAAAEAAIAADIKTKEIVEKITGQKLTGGSRLKEAWSKLPVGGLLGILMLIFGFMGSGIAGKKVTGV